MPLIFFGVLFYWPLSKILSLGFKGDWLETVLTQRNASLVWFTIWQAMLSAGLSLLFGIPGAYALYNRVFPGQKFLRSLITVPFMLPTIVVAIGFTAFRQLPIISQSLMGHSGAPIIICANLFMNYSLAVRIIGGVWTTLDESIENAAALDGAGRLRTLISITLPQLAKSITSAGTLIFLYCAANFGIVLVLGGASTRTIETEIYVSATQNLDLPRTSGLILVQTVLTILAFVVAQRFSKGLTGFTDSTSLSSRAQIDRRDLPAIAITSIFIGGVILVPLATILIRAFRVEGAFSFTNFTNLAGHGARDLLAISVGHASLNTLRNAVITTILSMSIGLLVSNLISRRELKRRSRQFQRAMDIAFQLPLGISTLVLGIGYLLAFGGGFFPLRSSWLVTSIAQSLLTIPLVVRLIYPALSSIDSELLESAETESATTSQIWWLIELPLIRDVLVIATGYSVIISIGEFGAANFLAYGDQGTLPTILFQLISRPGTQNYGMAMATSSLLIGFVFLIVYLVSLFDTQKR